jgi:SAM-dependent methyltransferase
MSAGGAAHAEVGTEAGALAACPVCGSDAAAPFATKDGHDFLRCAGCGFVYLERMPGDGELAALYNADGGAQGYDAKRRSRARRACMKLPRFFAYAWRKDTLDLGCGGGLMVAALGRIARRAVGLDIAAAAVARARADFPRFEFIAADYRAAGIADAAFDFVHASEIIEHVNDLAAFMGFLARIVRPGGHVYVTTPDIGHPKVPAAIGDWDVFAPPRHVQFFDRATLTMLFERHGFEARRKYRDAKPGLQMMFRKRADDGESEAPKRNLPGAGR